MPKLNWDGDDFRNPQDSNGTVADNISRNGNLQQGYFHGSLTEGLVAYYPMDSGSGSTLTDQALDNDGAINGASWTNNSKIGENCLDFDGQDDYVGLGNFNYRDNLVICAWARPTSVTGVDDHSSVFSNNDNNAGDGFAVTAYEQGNWYFYHAGEFIQGPQVSTGEWVHIIMIINEGNFFQAYFNGQKIGEIDISANGNTIDTPYNTRIGSVPNGSDSQENPFKGLIDDVRIFGRRLSDPEIKALYNKTNASKVTPGDTLK